MSLVLLKNNNTTPTKPLLSKRTVSLFDRSDELTPPSKRTCSENKTPKAHTPVFKTPIVLQSPTKQSKIQIFTNSTVQRAGLVKKVSHTNIKNGTETTFYTIAVIKSLKENENKNPLTKSTEDSSSSNTPNSVCNNKSPAKALQSLKAIAASELKKPSHKTNSPSHTSQSHAVIQSLEHLNSLHCGTHLRVKTSISKAGETKRKAAATSESKKCFSFVFK